MLPKNCLGKLPQKRDTSMNRKLKVAIFNTQPPHLYFGGVERRIVETARLLTNNVDMVIYSGTKKGFNKTAEVNGTRIVPCFSTDMLYPLDNLIFNQSISRMVDRIKADIYEAHAVSGYGFLKALKKRKLRKPFIQTVHGVLADEYIQSSKSVSPTLKLKLSNFFMWHLSRIEKEASKKATLVVTVSRYSAQKIVQLYDIDEKKIRIVPNGVDLQKFKPTEDCDKVKDMIGGNCEHIILFVGNLIPRKGLHFLIEAAKEVLNENKETKFVIVGDGPLRNHLITYSKEMGVSGNFIFLGHVDDNALPSLYTCADIVASPSIQEGQGISLLEAQATAKPVVAFNVGGINEVVTNKETGLLIKPDSYELARAILCLLSNKSLREKMGLSGREFVSKNFAWEICARKMFKIYSEASELRE